MQDKFVYITCFLTYFVFLDVKKKVEIYRHTIQHDQLQIDWPMEQSKFEFE